METSKKYYPQITALKGLAIFLVVLGHAIIVHPINLHDIPFCGYLFKFVSSVHMPLFFMISGFCFSYKENYGNYILKKVARLIVPYIVFNILDMIPRFLLPQLVNRSQDLLTSILDTLLTGGQYWFLYTLFIIFLIYPLIYKLQSKSSVLKVVTTILLLALSIVKINTSLFTLSAVSYYLMYFNIGNLIRNSNIKIYELKLPKQYFLIPVILFVLWIGLLLSPFATVLRIPLALIGIVCCYFLSQSNLLVSIFERFGNYSLQLYLLNGFLLVLARTIICKLTTAPILIISFNMAITFVLPYFIIKYIVNRSKILKTLMGIT